MRGTRGSKALNEAQDNLLFNAVAVDAVNRAVEQRSTTAVFAVPGRSSVAANGKPHRVHIAHASLAMITKLHAIPRASLNAYVTGRVENATDMPILPGAANVFVGPDLIGSAALDFVAPRETANLYLGVDESMKITRRLEEKDSGVLTFFSKRKRLSGNPILSRCGTSIPHGGRHRHLRIDAGVPGRAHHRRSRYPVAEAPERNDRGMMRWDLTIDAGKEGKVAFSYRIDAPSDHWTTSSLQELENRLQIRR